MLVRRSVAFTIFVPLVLGLGLSSCSQSSNAPESQKNASASSTTKASSAKPTKPAKPKPTKPKKKPRPHRPAGPPLPQSCGGMISTAAMNRALGKPLKGKTIYIKGVPQRKIQRTGRITCRYGVRGKSVAVEIGVSGYETQEAAVDRVAVTIRSEREAGAAITSRRVAGHDVTIMLGAKSGLLVTRDGRRTAAITIDKGYYRGAPGATLKAVAGTVLNNMPLS